MSLFRGTTLQDPAPFSPPSPPPRQSQGQYRHDANHLSLTNCPAVFIPFLKLWSSCVPTIQNLAPEYQHDLARIICGLPPLAQPLLSVLNRLAADLRFISIEISQRRSFQDRYANDLQAAIDVGGNGSTGSGSVKASFVPPPMYAPSASPSYTGSGKVPPSLSLKPPLSSSHAPPHSAHSRQPSPSSGFLTPPQTPPRQRTPTIATPTSPAIELIRETLYAALADVLVSSHCSKLPSSVNKL